MPCDLSNLLFTVGELAFGAIAARTLLFPAAAKFGFVEPELAVVGTGPGCLSTGNAAIGSRRRRGGTRVVDAEGLSGRGIWTSVLNLEPSGHDLRNVLTIVLIWIDHGGRWEHAWGERAHVAVEQSKRGGITKVGGVGG